MVRSRSLRRRERPRTLEKAPSGIRGLDDITGGGLPRGRPTLVCGTAGCGKTLLALEFLARGALDHGEPGVFMSFEERAEDLVQNVPSLGVDLRAMERDGLIAIDHVRVERGEIEETGEYDLEGLFIRLAHAIDAVGARRVVLDTIESLFSGLANAAILRSELRRLFGFLKDRGVTAVITGERGDGQLTRQGLEEYVSDCVILLDHRVEEQVSTRRLRIVKYRGSHHGTDEYPFLIDDRGITVLPITGLRLDHAAPMERIPTGVPALDQMLDGQGYFRGSTVLVSGAAGTGKTTLAAHLVDAACRRGERAVWFAFEESPSQIMRNMRSVGVDLAPWTARGLLQLHAARPTVGGLEMHLTTMHRTIEDTTPQVVVLDPITNLTAVGTRLDATRMLVRLMDLLKTRGVTAFLTSLTHDAQGDTSDVAVSSLVDTWLLLRNIEANGERNRGLYVLKSRGMAHSNQIREFVMGADGIQLLAPWVAPGAVLTGSARVAQEARERDEGIGRDEERSRQARVLARRREALDAQIAALEAAFAADAAEVGQGGDEDRARTARAAADRAAMSVRRGVADALPGVRSRPHAANGRAGA